MGSRWDRSCETASLLSTDAYSHLNMTSPHPNGDQILSSQPHRGCTELSWQGMGCCQHLLSPASMCPSEVGSCLTDLRGYHADILWTERAQPHSSSDLCQFAGSRAYSAIPWQLWVLCCHIRSQNIPFFKMHLMCVHKGRHYLMPCKGHPTQTSIRGASRVSKSIGRPGFGLAKLLKQKKKKLQQPMLE